MQLMAKFRYALRMIRFMVRLELSLKHYSRNVDQQQTIEQVSKYCNASYCGYGKGLDDEQRSTTNKIVI